MTPLMLLPGMMCDENLFTAQVNAFKGDRLVMVANVSVADNMPDIARDILAQAPESFALAGLSMGGIVAMEILRQAPHRVERLALLDTNPKAELIEVQSNRNRQIEIVQNGGLSQLMHSEMFPHYLADNLPLSQVKNILERCDEMAMKLGPQAFIRESRALQKRVDQQGVLSKYKGPTLILMGEQDKLCPLDRHQLMHSLLENSKLVLIENAGHLTTLEQPQAVNAALREWLSA